MIFIYSLLLFICYFNNSYAKETINILINKPDFNENEYLKKYNEVIEQYIEINRIDNYDIKFSYCSPTATDGEHLSQVYKDANSPFSIDVEYARNFNCTLRELKNSNYDIMILDDRFLYGDNGYADYLLLKDEFDYNKLTNYFVDYNNYNINNENINHHDTDIFNDGKLGSKKNLYGLPYELDFDLVYYHESNINSKDLLTLKVSDSSFGNELPSEEILSAGFGDNDEIFNFFSEFIRYQYDIPKGNDPKTYELLSNNDAKKIYDSFRKYILRFTGDDIEKTLNTTIKDAYNTFLDDKNKLLRGKASWYKNLKEIENVSIKMNSLPQEITVINQKYVVINKNSPKQIEELVKVALLLSSKEMQIYRALQMGIIPTFKFKDSSDESVVSYCQTNSEICEILKKLNPIRVNNIFRKKNISAQFLEIRLIVPLGLKKTLIDPSNENAKLVFYNILDNSNGSFNSEMSMTLELGMFMILSILDVGITIIFLFIMYKVYINRKHPYIKAMSPQLTNLTILGIVLRMIYPFFYIIVTTRFLCRMTVIISFVINNIIYIPLFAIVFRIYYIYTNISSVSYGKKLNDRRLLIYIITILITSFPLYILISYVDKFQLESNGSLQDYRFITCVYNVWVHTLIMGIYTFILFACMLAMTFKIRTLSKKYGDTTFIFFIIVLTISQFFFQIAFNLFLSDGSQVKVSSLLLNYLHLFISLITVYILIGNRLLFIRKHPVKNKEKLLKGDFDNVNNLVNFIHIRKSDDSSFSFFRSFRKSKTNTGSATNNSSKFDSIYSTKSEVTYGQNQMK
ncbi:hypothetical protein LY90DRAFT_664641 [Neocallimastix californiae]|uniref:G-protein coupled receptors family 3 profile domain-containing protein n=1 Tax=Neocallimastix californiae TaxID=1754190 RepID=A0A1Y2F6R2_9FUNG|nr:hypothetical protein LY90DRAFT_664641 [Neocallimastix californiae]|eukprot:ORY79573.1 hypothetical protein LY90DRAFT_664641 [Neocallimastix californiae]